MAEEKSTTPVMPKVTNHLLDIEKFNGKFEGRSSPALLFLGCILAPPLLLWSVVINLIAKYGAGLVLTITIIIYVLYVARLALIILCHEKERKARYKKHLYRKYDDVSDIVRVKNVQIDGCVEYFNGTISYMVVAYNGNVETFSKFSKIAEFIQLIPGHFDTSCMVQNLSDTTQIDKYYQGVGNFTDRDTARDYLKILDRNREFVEDNSLVVRIVYNIHGKATDRIELKRLLMSSLPKKAYYEVHMASREEVLEVFSHEIGTTLDIETMIANRFARGRYFKSKVIGYDVGNKYSKTRRERKDVNDVVGFMVKH